MRRIVLSVALIFSAAGFALAQKDAAELARIRTNSESLRRRRSDL